MKNLFALVSIICCTQFSPAISQVSNEPTCFLNISVIGSTPGMSDGMIILDLAGDYTNEVEFKVINVGSTEYIVQDTLSNIDFTAEGAFTIYTLDALTGDTLLISTVESFHPEHDFSITLNSFIPDVDSWSNGSLSADLSFESIPFSLAFWGSTQEIIYNCPLGSSDLVDSLYFINLIPGFYYFSIDDTLAYICSSFKMGNEVSPLTNAEVFTTPTSTSGCIGTASINAITGGIGPFQYFWNGSPGGDQTTGLCAGVHSLMVIDDLDQTIYTVFGIADSINFFDNSNVFSSYSDTIFFQTSDCNIDYSSPIDSIKLVHVEFSNDSTIQIVVGVWQMGLEVQVVDSSYFNTDLIGNVLLDFTSVCLTKSEAHSVVKFRAPLFTLHVESISNNTFKIFPNPANHSIAINNTAFHKIVFTNLNGAVCLETNENTIDISNLETGVYFVSVFDKDSNLIFIQKLIKF